jgi:hypothetical protein
MAPGVGADAHHWPAVAHDQVHHVEGIVAVRHGYEPLDLLQIFHHEQSRDTLVDELFHRVTQRLEAVY